MSKAELLEYYQQIMIHFMQVIIYVNVNSFLVVMLLLEQITETWLIGSRCTDAVQIKRIGLHE